MSNKKSQLSYIKKDTPIHRLSGATKLLMILFISLAAMLTFDTRLLAVIGILSVAMFIAARIPLRDMKIIVYFLIIIMLMNITITFLFSPEEGVRIYGTRTEITHLFGRYYLVEEQLFYQLNQTLKYFAILPLALIFFITTEPSEFAASLNKIRVNYKIAYSITLALRYIPAIQREYHEISQAQQARGVDISKNVKLTTRVKGMITILFPLIITSIDKIERIANAMELRSFGKNPQRTWYRTKPFKTMDFAVITASALLVGAAVALFFVNGGRFLNPFV
jgi:energy-coupling factor transport system permease protein